MTPIQLTTLKADILANTDQRVIDGLAANDYNAVADVYNEIAIPDFFVYRTNITPAEVKMAVRLADVANITATNKDRLLAFFELRESFDGSNADTRDGFDDVLSVASADPSQQAIAALWKTLASKVEKLFAVGTGTLALPAIRGYTGTISLYDVAAALNS